MWDFKLIKQAKEKKNTKRYASRLNEKDTDISLRHMIPFGLGRGAQLEALRGGSPKDQVESNWDALKLALGATGGMLGGAAAGAAAGYGIGDAAGGRSNRELGTAIGAITGALGGGWLGNYLTFKTMANNRNVDSDYSWRHLTPFGVPAQLAALQGYDPNTQVTSNIDNIKIAIPAVVGGVGGQIAGSAAGPAGVLLGQTLGASAGELGAYKLLKSDRINGNNDDDDDED